MASDPSSPADNDSCEGDDLEDVDSAGEDAEVTGSGSARKRVSARTVLTGRGVTMAMLLSDGILEPGDACLSIDYLGQKFVGDLLPNGKIKWQGSNRVFNSPSAWAIHCKKMVNPSKKSGCGWASVKYKGKKLDIYKTIWFRKQRGANAPSPANTDESMEDEEEEEEEEEGKKEEAKKTEESATKKEPVAKPKGNDSQPGGAENRHDNSRPRRPVSEVTGGLKTTSAAAPLSLSLSGSFRVKQDVKERPSVKHTSLGSRDPDQDPNTLVEYSHFSALGKMQPFTMSITTNCLLLMDFHCHLTTSEVVGYLGGKWDPASQHLSILQAFPCRCRLGDKENAIVVEEEIRQGMMLRGLSLVGWYHSHPHCQADPSLRDVDCQMEYQVAMKGLGATYQPCVGFIVAPFPLSEPIVESAIQAFWVMPPPEHKPHEYGMPMSMNFTAIQDSYLTQDVVNEMKWVSDYYSGAPDFLFFKEPWHQDKTFLEKVKGSLAKKLPKDQVSGQLLDFVQSLLVTQQGQEKQTSR
ncbi:PREDICTED: MPN domain-containing protein-like [Branchiostoma belcheri]|uniref:MPN domain-containing protein n=1 Tax=Branchiostoma belcheri TaxID=7741 RepID=A0A6P4XLV4_BRABE|nr:PREDICTED: MPN domain-containing protein-like [Branchiostoma belcheri]